MTTNGPSRKPLLQNADPDVPPSSAPDPVAPDGPVRLSTIIVNWNTLELLRACLRSLQQFPPTDTHEVIVVDNASSDGSAAMVHAEFRGVRLLALDENLGFSRGNNAGIAIARGEYIFLLNSDTEVRENALQRMIDYMDAHPDVAATGAKLVSPDGSIQESCRAFPSHRTALFNRKSLLTRLFPGNRYSRQYLLTDEERLQTREVDWVMGAALMTRRSVVEEVGALDPNFFMYAEDVDWCYRMHEAGGKIVYLPDAAIMHHYEKSARKAPFRMNFQRHKSMWLFYKKHYRGGFLLDVVTLAGIGARMAVIALTDVFRPRRP